MALVYPGESAFSTGYYQNYPTYYQGYYPNYPQPVTLQPVQNAFTEERRQQPKPRAPRDWSTGICGCCEDKKSCLLVAFCQECFACHLASKAGETCCLPCCVPGWMISLRAHIRAKHRIKGSILKDCCMVACCYPCAMCQLSRELDNIEIGTAPR